MYGSICWLDEKKRFFIFVDRQIVDLTYTYVAPLARMLFLLFRFVSLDVVLYARPMLKRRLLGLGVATLLGCGTPPVAPSPVTMKSAIVDTAQVVRPPQVSAIAPPPAPPEPIAPQITMYAVAEIYSLLDITVIKSGLELRLGYDPGGGAMGQFRFVPWVNGAPDFEHETDEMSQADTTGYGYVAIHGNRPNIFMHKVSGFRSAATDSYWRLDEKGQWRSAKVNPMAGLGEGIFSWSKDRLLEWRDALSDVQTGAKIPKLRVVQGAPIEAPSLPKPLEKQLITAGFYLDTYTVLETGEVLAIGHLAGAGGFGTLLWTDDLNKPAYFVSKADDVKEGEQLSLLGGTSLANIRLRVLDRVMRLDGASWVVESTIPKGGLPDVWFGSTLVMRPAADTNVQGDPSAGPKSFARMTKDGPWLPIGVTNPNAARFSSSFNYMVDSDGTIWAMEGDMLVSSRKPEKRQDITEEMLLVQRKKSVLRGN
jgi:hypothetical protein